MSKALRLIECKLKMGISEVETFFIAVDAWLFACKGIEIWLTVWKKEHPLSKIYLVIIALEFDDKYWLVMCVLNCRNKWSEMEMFLCLLFWEDLSEEINFTLVGIYYLTANFDNINYFQIILAHLDHKFYLDDQCSSAHFLLLMVCDRWNRNFLSFYIHEFDAKWKQKKFELELFLWWHITNNNNDDDDGGDNNNNNDYNDYDDDNYIMKW